MRARAYARTNLVISTPWCNATQDEIDAAYVKIDEVAGRIGAISLPPGQGGKLENFLRLYCPDVVSALVAAGIWPSK